ncbi:hypothetical protein IMCC3135_26160 [Granulosicoccus antarcticus IMCC3135]|uniref:Uncharacterized protein n=2 Tax=Granulosicoccus TaxID=437504 RepID=A0A2Z2P3R4_9GAMM|nr:hypothetical protein IMCC3135_26160 [Granulosicoccus antarcticus IMCC3135]
MAPVAVKNGAVSTDLPNPLWQCMAGLRFVLCDCVSVDTLNYGGSNSYLLRNAFNLQQLRLSQGVFQLLEKMDGQRTLEQVCALSTTSQELTPIRQHEIISTITQLQAAGMVESDKPREVATLVEQHQEERRRRQLARWMRLISPRFCLLNPDQFLTRSFPWIAWLFQPLFLFVWLGISLYAGSQALMQWDALTTYGAQRLDDPGQWVLLVCVYPIVKGLHELGHCFAAKSGGAAVNEMGITLLVFLPVPYVDASAASVFADKYRRMLVGAAGIMVEVFLASVALFVWLHVDDGLLRDSAFAIMLIGGVSTLLFNGNPLLRFDGYYVLADAIEIPNLSSRASQYHVYLFRRYVLGADTQKPASLTTRERRWFAFYGVAALVYRTGVSIGIALFLMVSVPVLGALMAIWLLSIQLLVPLVRQFHYLMFSPALTGRRVRAVGLLAGGFSVFAGLLTLASFPSSTVVDGVVLLPDHAVVRAEVDGFLQTQTVADETSVERGDVLFVLTNAPLKADIDVLQARVFELQTRHDLAGFDQRVARDIHAERLTEAKADLLQLRQREAGLVVRSPGMGTLQVPFGHDREGRFIHQGDMLAYLANQADVVIRVVATQKDASRIREGSGNIEVRLAERSGRISPGTLLREVPLASDQLPNAALGSRSGGAIQVDARDERGTTVLERVFAFDITIPFSARGRYVGSRASVRFQHSSQPLLPRWIDEVKRMISKKLDPV